MRRGRKGGGDSKEACTCSDIVILPSLFRAHSPFLITWSQKGSRAQRSDDMVVNSDWIGSRMQRMINFRATQARARISCVK